MRDRTACAWYARSFMLMAQVWLGVFKKEHGAKHGAKQAQSALFLETENRWLGSYSQPAACPPCHFARRGGIRKGLKQEGSCNLRLQHLSLSSHMLHFKVFSKRSWPFTSAPRSDVVWAAKQRVTCKKLLNEGPWRKWCRKWARFACCMSHPLFAALRALWHCGMQESRSCFLQFLTGLFQINPKCRWTAKQADPCCTECNAVVFVCLWISVVGPAALLRE